MGGVIRRQHEPLREEIEREFAPHVIEKYVDGMPGYDGQSVAYVVARNGEVRYLAVVLYEVMRDARGEPELYTKVMDETEGPNYYDAPLDFLEGLSEPLAYAAGYREKVRARAAARRAPKRVSRERDYGGAYDGIGTVFSDAEGGL